MKTTEGNFSFDTIPERSKKFVCTCASRSQHDLTSTEDCRLKNESAAWFGVDGGEGG